jgi:hypothetical protein
MLTHCCIAFHLYFVDCLVQRKSTAIDLVNSIRNGVTQDAANAAEYLAKSNANLRFILLDNDSTVDVNGQPSPISMRLPSNVLQSVIMN